MITRRSLSHRGHTAHTQPNGYYSSFAPKLPFLSSGSALSSTNHTQHLLVVMGNTNYTPFEPFLRSYCVFLLPNALLSCQPSWVFFGYSLLARTNITKSNFGVQFWVPCRILVLVEVSHMYWEAKIDEVMAITKFFSLEVSNLDLKEMPFWAIGQDQNCGLWLKSMCTVNFGKFFWSHFHNLLLT